MLGWVLRLLGRGRDENLLAKEPSRRSNTATNSPRTVNTKSGRIRIPLRGNGSYSFDIVGEASYQDALASLAGKKTRSGVSYDCQAIIDREPQNKFDANAVAVTINGQKVGYFSREDAADYSEQMLENGRTLVSAKAAARIVGGFKTKEREGHFGVKLDITRHT